MPKKPNRVVNISVLPGEPTDGSGRVCIHLFIKDDKGSFTEPHALYPVFKDGVQVKQELTAGPMCGRLACDPKRTPVVSLKGKSSNLISVLSRTDDPRAVTCPKCIASEIYRVMMEKFATV